MKKATLQGITQWTAEELAILKEHYPTRPAQALAPMLPGRSEKSIRHKAKSMGIAKKVHSPKFWRPIGSERMDRGHLIRKVTDTGKPKKDWKRVEVIEWEAVHGPIPPGMQLMVKDSALPRTQDNLALYTHKEHWNRTRAKNLPQEILQLYQLRARIQREVDRLSQPQAE